MSTANVTTMPATASRFIATKGSNNFLGIGDHKVSIHAIQEVTRQAASWKDQTPQVEVLFKDNAGLLGFTCYYNLIGYVTTKDEQTGKTSYTTDQNGMRIADADKTAKARAIFLKMAYSTGLDEGEGFEVVEDLIGGELVIKISANGNNQLRVTDTSRVPNAKETAKATALLNGDAKDVPAPPVATAIPSPPAPVKTAGPSYEDMITAGWNDALLLASPEHKHLVPVTNEF